MKNDEITIISRDQIEDGTPNDNPLTAFNVRLPGGKTGWIAGWHGVSCCAIGDWLEWAGPLSATRAEAIEQDLYSEWVETKNQRHGRSP